MSDNKEPEEKWLTLMQSVVLITVVTYGTIGFLYWLFGGTGG